MGRSALPVSEEHTERDQTVHAVREGLIVSACNQGGVN